MTKQGRRIAMWVIALTVAFLLLTKVSVDIHGNWEGIFLLEGRKDAWVEVTDDLLLGDGARLIAWIDFASLKVADSTSKKIPRLEFRWNEEDGSGFVRNILPDGRIIFTSLGRFGDGQERRVRGTFVGGGLPESSASTSDSGKNETGMAYFDGTRWFHLWCNVNEALLSSDDSAPPNSPDRWGYLGSRVLNSSSSRLSLTSRHEVVVDNVTLQVDRFIHFRAGDPYFRLSVRIQNPSDTPVRYTYVYGDDPWLGDFGTSEGNVGWTRDGVVATERFVDTKTDRFIGMADIGSPFLPRRKFTGMANFVEWLGPNIPDLAYFSNSLDMPSKDGAPLVSNERYLSVEWGPRTLEPMETHVFYLAVGMASVDRTTGRIVKPEVRLSAPLLVD